jgi:hypothetical protein
MTLSEIARELLIELEGGSLDVVLIPAPEQRFPGQMVRAVQGCNAEWYREFCAMHQGARRRHRLNDNDTLIKRQQTTRALERMMAGQFISTYVRRLITFINKKQIYKKYAIQYRKVKRVRHEIAA